MFTHFDKRPVKHDQRLDPTEKLILVLLVLLVGAVIYVNIQKGIL